MPSNMDLVLKKCCSFTRKQNMYVLQHLVEAKVKISEGADGCRINLTKLNKKQLQRLKKKVIEIEEQHKIPDKYKL
jgi:tRNA uridine 5-carbamoylmethylation protein Kti12